MNGKSGGSAFPVFEAKHGNTDYDLSEPGMTLRDYFAGQALIGITSVEESSPEITAKWAYAIADAMIEARDKVKDGIK